MTKPQSKIRVMVEERESIRVVGEVKGAEEEKDEADVWLTAEH